MRNSSKATLKLLDAAATVLARDASASLGDIAERAGVGRATLHRHFPTRRHLVRALTLDALHRLAQASDQIARAAQGPEQAFRLLIEAIVPLGDRYRFLASDPLRGDETDVRIVYDRRRSDLTAHAEALKAAGLIARDVPTPWVVASIDALVHAAWQAVEAGEIARLDAPDLVFATLTRGLGEPRPP